MQKITFQDTEVVKAPYVEINGVEYPVESEYQGGTDLDAETFNQMQDNIEDAIDNIPLYDDTEMKTGWYELPIEVTFTFSSFDSTNHIAILNTSVDLTEHIGVGTKLRFYNIGVKKYGIITAITSSSVTIYLGTQSISEGAIEFPKYAITETPVDYPQNMSNLSQLYLSVETVCGVWIDGKPLYRKVVSIGSLGNNTTKTVAHNISNLGIITHSEFSWLDGNTYWWSDYRWDSSSIYIKFNVDSTNIRIESMGTNWSSRTSDCYAILEYTKTTD